MKAHGGAIVNMLANVWDGMPLMAHSGAARAGTTNFTQSAALEWAASGVRVNAVAPGFIASAGLDSYDPDFARASITDSISATPLKRFGEEAEISSAIVYLLSPGAAYITGTCVCVDGGISLNRKQFGLEEHDKSAPYRGFHRAVAPAVLKDLEPILSLDSSRNCRGRGSVTVASSTVDRPMSVIRTSVVRPSVGYGNHSTRPAASSRRMACVTLVRAPAAGQRPW